MRRAAVGYVFERLSHRVEVALHARVARGELRGPLELSGGTREVAAPGEHAAEVLERLDVVGIAAQRGAVVRDRLVGLSRAEPDVAEVRVRPACSGSIASAAA